MGTKFGASNKNNAKPELTFTKGSIPKAMVVFIGPYMLGILLQNLYGAVDLFVVGHYAQTADVSAVTIGSQLMSIVTQLIIGFATGITMLIGQAYGAKDTEGLSKTTGSSILLFGGAAVMLTAVYIVFHKFLVNIMQTPAQAISATESYLLACAAGIPFIVGYNVVTSILTGLGDSKTPFLFIAVACVVNIVLDIVLVRYVGMGALGAAVATTLAQVASFLFSIAFLKKKGLGFPFTKQHIRFDKFQVMRIFKIGGPVAVQNVLVGASFLFVTAIINQMGLIASAAVGVVEKLITFLFVPATALGTAVGTASAQNLGAQQYERASKSMWYGVIMALVPSVIITIFCQFGGSILTGILTNDSDVIYMATDYLRSYIVDIIMVSFVFCMNGYFNSCGKSWFSLVHSLATTFAVRVPLAFILSRLPETSLFLIGWAAPVSTFVSLLMCLVFLSRQKHEETGFAAGAVPALKEADDGAHNVIITISREYGSGGRLVGEKVAEMLGIAFYNRNLIDLTAKQSGLAEGYIAKWEERISSRFIWNPVVNTRGGGNQFRSYYNNEDKMFITQSNIIRELAAKPCVIVGRCADYILRDHPDCINVFVRSDEQHKIDRLVAQYGIEPSEAAETAANTDKGRANYYSHYTNMRWGDRKHYHIIVDSGLFGIDHAAEIIVDSVKALYPEFAKKA